MISIFWQLLRRDLVLAARQGNTSAMAVMFFVVTVSLFPLGIGPELAVLERISAGVIWVAALLAALITLDRVFQADFEDGSLDLLSLGGLPLGYVALAKTLAHWLTTGIPLVVISPLLAMFMNMAPRAYVALLASMIIGTLALSLIGAIGAALTVGVRRGGVLLSLLVLPLDIPVLIFGVAAVEAAALGQSPLPHLMILSGLTLLALVLAPLAAGAALKLSVE